MWSILSVKITVIYKSTVIRGYLGHQGLLESKKKKLFYFKEKSTSLIKDIVFYFKIMYSDINGTGIKKRKYKKKD